MKKLFTLILTIVMMTTLVAAYADDLGVQIIGGEEVTKSILLDDLIIDTPVEIPDYAIITPVKFIPRTSTGKAKQD